jgi:hypothetical protein
LQGERRRRRKKKKEKKRNEKKSGRRVFEKRVKCRYAPFSTPSTFMPRICPKSIASPWATNMDDDELREGATYSSKDDFQMAVYRAVDCSAP